ncbi:ABC transporter substrate-binding protein [Cellvibrio mixtus]|uniref:ABC transporter substrate-binding protein n=1 Tax=Cellvibrio mixtus TaxID=39650 RepID=UPI000586791D|nr:ABC transporter substrate-binding protein [Cellvibrio mixtus]
MRFITRLALALSLVLTSVAAHAETIRIAIGTQDTTINCATGGLLIRELKLLEKYLPKDGKYKDAKYEIEWKNFTSGAPLTNEMVAGKLDFGAMADFPGSFNGVAHEAAGKRSIFISVLSGSIKGSGNGIVVPAASPVQSLAELKGKTISVPFASTSHGMLLRAVKAQGWDLDKDVRIIAQAPEIAGSALKSNRIDAHADFVPFAELFPNRGFARKIYDGSQANAPTYHGTLVDEAYAKKYPEIVVAYLRAAIEADRLIAAEPEKYSELIEKLTGIEAEVNYLFHGPLGLQTRDLTWKPEYRQATSTAIETLKLLKRTDKGLDVTTFINDKYLREAFKQSGRDYEAALKDYSPLSLDAKDAVSGKTITDFKHLAQLWVRGEPLVRHYASFKDALAELQKLEEAGTDIRAIYAQASDSGIKLLANQAWFVQSSNGQLDAFLLKDQAENFAKQHGGKALAFSALREQTVSALNEQSATLR